MTFWEFEPFYGEKTELSSLFGDDSNDASRDGENENENENDIVVGMIPCPLSHQVMMVHHRVVVVT